MFDVGAKWTATAILLNVFAGVPLIWGVLLTGGITLIYSVVGGLWADGLTDLGQFAIQLPGGSAMFIAVLAQLGGISAIRTIWSHLPQDHAQLFNGQYSVVFTLGYLLDNLLSYNGETWNLAQRFIAAPTGRDTRRPAILSAVPYLVWPLGLFFPMWAAPILLPSLHQPTQAYALLTQQLLPPGLIGLVLAGIFAHTMAMSSSDANAAAAVVTRDIPPVVWRRARQFSESTELLAGRAVTFLFIVLSVGIALCPDSFGGVIGLILLWYGALVGPIAIPMLFGMLPLFRGAGPAAAIISLAAGIITFILVKYVAAAALARLSPNWTTTFIVAGPVLCSAIVNIAIPLFRPYSSARVDALLDSLGDDSGPLPVPAAAHTAWSPD